MLILLLFTGCTSLRHQLGHVAGSAAQRLADDVVIERDEWGVPHISGRSDAAVVFGLAFAMAEDGYRDIEERALRSLGWMSNYYGEAALAGDLERAAQAPEAVARAAWASEPEPRRRLWLAYAEGLNHYLRTHPTAARRLIVRWEPWMLLAPTHDPTVRGTASASTAAGALLTTLDAPWFGAGRLYEAELRSASGWHASGVAVLGEPVLSAGHGERAAWALLPPAGERRALVLGRDGDTLAYRVGDAWRRATVRPETVAVNTVSGVVQRVFPFLDTEYGPVVARSGDTAWVQSPVNPARWLAARLALSQATSRLQVTAALGTDSARPPLALWLDREGVARFDGRAQADTAVSVDALERAAFDTRAAAADTAIVRLVDEWEMVGGSNPRRAMVLDSTIESLRAWDRRFDAASRPAAMFALWQEEQQGTAYRSGAFPRFRALEATVARIERERIPVSRGWGEILRLQRSAADTDVAFADSVRSLPLSAAPAGSGAPFEVRARSIGWRRYGVGGRAWTALTVLGGAVTSRSVQPFGPVPGAAGAQYSEQAEQFACGQLKDAWFGEAQLAGHVRERYRPGQRGR